MKIFTIGVYNSSEEEFFNKLSNNSIDTFCDIRQRRGVRGHDYKFVNSLYLQKKLAEMGILYKHIIELAPTKDIREKQWAADTMLKEQKRTRNHLGRLFIQEYCECILCKFDFDSLIDGLNSIGAKNIALFCVEERPQACHRSIVANELRVKYGFEVIDL